MQFLRLTTAILLISAPLVSHADPIRFDWTNNGTTATLLSGSGYWIIDDSDIAPGFGDYLTRITSFSFQWQTTGGTFSSSSDGSGMLARGFMNFDSSLNLIGFDICTSSDGNCAAQTGHPLIRVTGGLWGATRGTNQTDFSFTPQAVTMSRVPEPGTLALIGIGLLGLGLARRKTL